MFHAIKNLKALAGAKTKEELIELCRQRGIVDYDISNISPTFQPPTLEQMLATRKKQKLSWIDKCTEEKITAGLISSCTGYPVKYDSDRDTQDKLALALGLVNAGVLQSRYPEGFPCRGYKQLEDGTFETEKTIHLMNAASVIQWNTEFGEHLKKCTAEGWAKQAEVNACTTKEELDTIVLE